MAPKFDMNIDQIAITMSTNISGQTDLDRDDSKHSDIRNVVPSTIDDTNTHNVNMSSRVNTLLSQLSSDDDGNRLANYEPIQKPAITINRTDVNDLLPQTIEKDVQPSKFVANDINLAKLSNYNQTYASPRIFQSRMPTTPPVVEQKPLESVKEGLRFVLNSKELLGALSLDLFAVLFGGAVAMVPVFARDILKVGPIGFGWLNAATDIGAMLIIVLITIFPVEKKQGKKLLLAVAGFGVCIIIFCFK